MQLAHIIFCLIDEVGITVVPHSVRVNTTGIVQEPVSERFGAKPVIMLSTHNLPYGSIMNGLEVVLLDSSFMLDLVDLLTRTTIAPHDYDSN